MNEIAGRELDALMWLLINDKPLDLLKCRYVDGDVQPHGGYPAGHISPDPFSTTWHAAGLVVLKLEEIDPDAVIRISNGDSDSCDVDILPGGFLSKLEVVHVSLEGGLERTPEAICLAALAAVDRAAAE